MTNDSNGPRWPSPGRLAEIVAENRAALAKLDGEGRTPAQIFAGAVAELAMALVYSSDAEERRRVAGLLQAVCAEASRIAAKRSEEAA